MKILHRGLILATLPFLVEVSFVLCLTTLLATAENERALEVKYRQATSLTAKLFGQMSMAPYFLSLGVYTKSERFMNLFDKKMIEVRQSRKEMDIFNHEHRDLYSEADAIKTGALLDSMLKVLDNMKVDAVNVDPASTDDPLPNVQDTPFCKIQGLIRNDVARMFDQGDLMTSQTQARLDSNRQNQFIVLIAGVLVNIIASIFLWRFYQQSILERLRIIGRNTEAIASRGWLIPELGGNDEIAKLDSAFHQMHKKLTRASELEQALFNNASDVIFVLDAENNFVQMNPAGELSWGYPLESLNILSLNKILADGDENRVREQIALAKSTDSAVSFDAGIRTRRQEVLYGAWSVYWSQETRNLYCIFHDVTAHRLVKEERKAFLSMITGDLQRPLLRIASALQTLVSSFAAELPSKAKDKLTNAERNLQRLLGLVKELIQVSEMESGTLELKPAAIPLAELLRSAASELAPLAAAKKIELVVQPSSPTVYADHDKVMQVLVNLLSNAIKFSPEGSEVELSARAAEDMVKFEVKDAGRGVPESQKDSIFQKFKQAEAADAKRKAGTGLGLPICKQIVEQHGGKIGVRSEAEKGSTFWFTLSATQNNQSTSLVTKSKSAKTSQLRSLEPNYAVANINKKGFRFTLVWHGILLICLPILFETVFVSGLTWSFLQVQTQRTEELKMRNIAFGAGKGLRSLLDLSGQLVCEQKKLGINFSPFEQNWDKAYGALTKAIGSDTRFTAAKEKLAKAYDHAQTSSFNFTGATNPHSVLDMVGTLMNLTNYLNKITGIAEKNEFVDPEIAKRAHAQQNQIMIYGLAANAVLSLLLSVYFALKFSRRLTIMADNTQRLVREDSLNPPVGGADEISDLDLSFHNASKQLIDSRKRERAVFDNCKDILCVLNNKGKFVSLNPAGKAAWGVDNSELVDLSLNSIVIPEDAEKLEEIVHGITEIPSQSLELRVQAADEQVLWTLWTITRGKGQSVSYCVVRDTSDRKQLEQFRQDFLAVVSHDLRTPLSGVLGTANLISSNVFGAISPGVAAQISDIETNCHTLLELITDVLDLEKLEAEQMQLNLSESSLKELMDSLSEACRKSNIAMQMRILEDGPNRPVVCDSDRFVQAMLNLIKYLSCRIPASRVVPFGGVFVQARKLEPGVEIQIFDAATEIPKAIQERLFDRIKGQSLKEGSSDATFHSELALPLAAQIMRCHTGSVVIQSRPQSNCFVLRFPYLPLEPSP